MIKVFLSRPSWVQPRMAKHLVKLDVRLEELGFKPLTVGQNVTSITSPFDEVSSIIEQCECAIILGLPQIKIRAGKERSGEIEESLRGERAYDGPIMGKSISVENGIPYQLRSLKNVRVYGPYLALSVAVLFVYVFNP